jgi:hypothetical protein
MNILFTGVGGPTPRSFAYSLRNHGTYAKDATLVGVDANPLAIGLYQSGLFNHSNVVPRADHAEYWAAMELVVSKYAIDYAIILPESEVLAWSKRVDFGSLPCTTFLPDSRLCEMLIHKSKTTAALWELGVVPKSVVFERSSFNMDEIFDQLGDVFWVRADSGTSGVGSLLVDGKDALINWIQINHSVTTFLASRYLPGRNLACKLLYWEGSLVRSACAERVSYIMSKTAPSGVTGNTSFGRLLNDSNLVDVAHSSMTQIFDTIGVPRHGFFTVDFKEDATGKPFITEINIRHVAFTQCFAAAGANLAEDTLRLISADPDFDKNYHMYEFPEGLIFLRDVDERPIVMFEKDLILD